MIILNLFILLLSSALTLRKESTIYYSRLVILTLLVSVIITYNNLYLVVLDKGVGLYGGIFNVNLITQSFSILILLVSAIILIYNSFYHRTFIKNHVGSWSGELNKITNIFKVSYKSVPLKSGEKSMSKSFTSKNNYDPILNGTILGNDNDTFKLGIYKIIEYPLIILFIITGALFLMSSGDLISVFISIELQSYGLYILSSIHRDSEQSTWGGLTYFLLGGLSSCFILMGSALLYINSGTTSLDGLYIISTINDLNAASFNSQSFFENYKSIETGSLPELLSFNEAIPLSYINYYYLNISLIFICVGFLFKVSAAPFHFWSPDVYDAIPTTVTTYVAIIAKISIFIFLLELMFYVNGDNWAQDSIVERGNLDSLYTSSWKNCILISSMLSLIIGSVLGLTQFRIKKVYAYSTINHVGFILLALCVNNTESIQAYIFYIISYTLSNLNAFIILVTIGYSLFLYTDKDIEENENTGFTKDNYQQLNNNLKTEAVKQTSHSSDSIQITGIQSSLQSKDYTGENRLSTPLKREFFQSKKESLKDTYNSPLQLVSQLKGFFYINSYLSLSLTITLFSFIGIPPLIGFFAKQMVLSASLNNGYVFITLIGILTSVISAVYYLNIVKQIFFFKPDYVINPYLKKYNFFGTLNNNTLKDRGVAFKSNNIASPIIIFNNNDIKISSCLSSIISILTLIILLFIFTPNESFNLTKILAILLLN